MKKIFLLIILIYSYSFSQNTSKAQKFPHLDFQIETPCRLYEDTTFKKLAKSTTNVKEALLCASEVNNASRASIYNIIVYNDEVGGAKAFITSYATNLKKAGIPYNTLVLDGIPALEYTFIQNGIPAKAMVFYRYSQSYLFQVTSRSLLNEKFLKLKNSFRKLN